MRFLPTFAICLAAFFALDLVWLGVVADGFYQAQLGTLLKEEVYWPAALLFYLVYVAGVVHFAVRSAVSSGRIARGFLQGAAFGLVTYAAFDLTALALIRDFGILVAVVDLAWGAVLGGTVSAVGTWFTLRSVHAITDSPSHP